MADDVQDKLLRTRPPRVRITYDVETGGAVETKELPFIVGVFADLKGDREDAAVFERFTERKMIDIDRDNFNDVMRTIRPRVSFDASSLSISEWAGASPGEEDRQLVFNTLDDFDPLNVVQALPSLKKLYQARSRILELQEETTPEEATAQRMHAAAGELAALIDARLNRALSSIMHCAGFQRIEAAWRGLHYLVSRVESGALLELRVLNVTRDELRDDLQKAVEFDQSHVFKIIHEAEYGTYGGSPYSLLVGDYAFDGSSEDTTLLKKMAEVAAAAHAPFVAQASPALFGLHGFGDLGKPRELKKIFEGMDFAQWREFREMEDARYVALVLPRFLLRLPHGTMEDKHAGLREPFQFTEQMASALEPDSGSLAGTADATPDMKNFLWGNPAYLLAERVCNAFSLYHWPVAIRGPEGGGLIDRLPCFTYMSKAGSTEMICPVEVPISDRREKELSDLGFISLCHRKGAGQAAFFSSQTICLPRKYISGDASLNAQHAAALPAMLAASRFAHTVKVIMREKTGSFMTRSNAENYLAGWIANYVLLDDNAAQEVEAAFPLRSASMVVTDVPGKPGAYCATLFVKPHFQMQELTASIRLAVQLPG